ncbi:MAG: lytic transglycosylase domain-containing protein [Hyphomicrobium sp.]
MRRSHRPRAKNLKVGAVWLTSLAAALAAVGPASAQDAAVPAPTAAATPAPATAPAAASAAATMPKPASPSKAEKDHFARLDKALAPVRDQPLGTEDATAIRDAVKAIGAGNLAKGLDLKAKVSNPVGIKLIEWFRLRAGYGTVEDFRAFLKDNPAWPDRPLLVARMEESIFTQGGSAASILEHFKILPPATGIGMAALASAHLASGDKDAAKALAAKAWREHNLPSTLESGFLDRFGTLLEPADHKWRFDRLVIDDIRWRDERNARAAIARRVVPLLAPEEQKKAPGRIALLLGGKSPVAAAGTGKDQDWGVVFHRIQALRRTNKVEEAAKLMLGAPTASEKIVSPDDWWVERRQLAYGALKLGKPKLAYDLVKEAGPLTVNPLKEQSFMAGWLALRYLKDAKLAEPHFQAMKAAADGPLSRAKAAYWLARTAEATGDKSGAETFYRMATEDPDTFHGLLSRQKLEPGRQPIVVKAPAEPTDEQIEKFVSTDAVRAVVIARKAALDASLLRGFIVHLRSVFPSEAEMSLVAHLSETVGDTQMAVRTGKAAIGDRKNLLYYAYPVHPFPAYTPLRKPPETALLLGIARQETEFNSLIVSGAGAKGLLQVMTITAKHVCTDYKIKCDIPRLLSDPAYNTMMASAYIGDRMDEFAGSYVLTAAGYNAGPGRARQWIREFGDPRDPAVDPIDWIERIPIQETREYVGKVLANVQVYRARLGAEADALRLEEDLNRARRAAAPKSDG